MSWNGAATGAAPFQPPSYATGYPGQTPYASQHPAQYGHQPAYNQYQAGSSHPHPGPLSQPPKSFPPKKKGNPIITRYPPPPGYRGPAQHQGPFGTTQNATPQQAFPQGSPYPSQQYQGPPPTQGYSTHVHGPSQQAPQPGYQHAQNYQWPQNYPPQSSVSHPPSYSASPHYSQSHNGYRQYANFPPPINTNQQSWSHAQGFHRPPGPATYPPSNQHASLSAPVSSSEPMTDLQATPTPASANPILSHSTSTTTQPQSATSDVASDSKLPLFLVWDDWDFDFDGAIWPKANEPVDPNLSLGVITWRPAKQVTRALPATFEEAEEQSLKPPAEKLCNGESVSLYFTAENSYEAFLDVRKTDDWYNIKDDPVFVVFTDEEMEQNLILIEECLTLRDRPDEYVKEIADEADEDMHDSTWNVMDNLEQALSGDMEDVKKSSPSHQTFTSLRDQAQEDILARLGVTGSPKPPSDEPVPVPFLRDDQLPASLPPKPPAPPMNIPPRPEFGPQRAQSYSSHRNSTCNTAVPRNHGSMSSATSYRSSTAPSHEHSNPQTMNGDMLSHGNGDSLSELGNSNAYTKTSRVTAVGPSKTMEQAIDHTDQDHVPIPQLKRNDSSFARKRSYEDTDQEDGHARQPDDHTKRKRRSLVDAAYSRR